jgi:hypothetical protein
LCPRSVGRAMLKRLPRPIITFPAEFQLINEQIAELYFIHAISPDDYEPEEKAEVERMRAEGFNIDSDYRCCEFWITLKDGPTYGFAAATPEFLRDYMTRENVRVLPWAGLQVVSEISLDVILRLVEECLSEAIYFGIEHFGYRMASVSNEEDSAEKQ